TITNACGDMWHGIEVWGNSNESQLSSDQGLVRIKNGGTIENSEKGVYTNRSLPDGEGGFVAGYTGGKIIATDANFVNNKVAVNFHSYSYQSNSSFTNCEFTSNASYLGSENPDYFIKMISVNGIEIEGCIFENSTEDSDFGGGIYSLNSHFTINHGCISGDIPCTEWQNSKFTNLQYGIYATALNPNRFVDIRNTEFELNYRGLFISGMANARVTSNNFIINEQYQEYGGYGMYLDNSTSYWVEDNDFLHIDNPLLSGETGVGLIIHNSGTDPNEVYLNSFTNLEMGILAQEQNRGERDGLQICCNDFDNCLADMAVVYTIPNDPTGIAASQGSSGSSPEDMAGNLFYIPSPTPNRDFDDINNEGNHITYYYPSNTITERVEPIDYTENTVTLVPKYVLPDDWSYENGCPPTEEPGGGSSGMDGLRGLMTETEQKIDSTENLLSLLVDGGNTESLQTEVDNSIPPQTMQVYNELMNKSPYLSDTVVSAAIEKEDVLPDVMIRDIMVANPNTAKSGELITKLDERWNPLPDYMKAQILQGRSIVSIREETEAKLAAFKLEKAKTFNALARYYLNDTINPSASLDSLTSFYMSEANINAKYKLAFLYLDNGNINAGQNVISDIPTQFNLDNTQQAEYQKMAAFYNLLRGLVLQDKSILDVDSLQTAELLNIEESQLGSASVYARNILLALNEIEYEETILVPDLLKSTEALADYEELLGKAEDAHGYIKIQPNPAKDYITIQYEMNNEGNAEIAINDMSGILKYSKKLQNMNDQIVVDTRNWKSGVYITTLKLNGKLIKSEKFTLIK
ncbi:MAG: T9SS type A sorting domain-containing protein, partial [Bacteroidales bacterium]|nr:T9SS type A sorting domain-containing protein [Bacteroidales bacterium]